LKVRGTLLWEWSLNRTGRVGEVDDRSDEGELLLDLLGVEMA
jgi:hypothetical protein